jgi:phosphoglycerate dehydrogenase-like enzyme
VWLAASACGLLRPRGPLLLHGCALGGAVAAGRGSPGHGDWSAMLRRCRHAFAWRGGSCGRRFASTSPPPLVVAVVSPPDSPALQHTPSSLPGVEFVVANDVATFLESPRLESVEAVVFVPPASPSTLIDLWPHLPRARWAHCFFAGVDSLAPFMPQLASSGVPLSNGRGAFSMSLAEYVMCAALHFNKRVPTIQKNREQMTWDKFVMPTLAGKTMGFLGWGDIAKATARVAKDAFGMRVMAVRRDPSKPSGDAVDEVLGEAERMRLFAESDFVVSVLPGTPETLNYCGEAEFAAMKASGVFISIGRGLAVDEEALAAALAGRQIAGAVRAWPCSGG